MSAEAAVAIPYVLPELEHRAAERVSRALGVDVGARAMVDWLKAGKPVWGESPACPGMTDEQLRIWWCVRWWLRRSPALELLAPAKLMEELAERIAAGDTTGAAAASQQIGRIAADFQHPFRREARELVLAMVGAGLQETERSKMLQRLEQAEQLIAGALLRGGAEAPKA